MELDIQTYDAQHEFLNFDSRYKGFFGGRGSGKTYTGWLFALSKLSENPDCVGIIAAPNYTVIRDVIIYKMEEIVPDGLYKYNQQKHQADFINDARILFRSLDTERKINRMRGPEYNWVWIDEAREIPEYAFDVLKGGLRQGENQQFAVTTTPLKNWLYDIFVEGESTKYQAIKNISSHDNPWAGDEYLDDLDDSYTEEFYRQEVLGEFVKFQGLVYTEFTEDENKISVGDIANYDFHNYIYAYDAGFRNPRVFLKIGVTTDDKYVVLNEFYRRQSRLSDAIESFNEMYEDDEGPVFPDPSAKGEIEELNKHGFRIREADNDVTAGIQKVKELLQSNNILVSELCQHTLNEFNSYRWVDDKKKDEPLEENDHAMDALRYAVFTRESGAGGSKTFKFG